MEATQEEMIAFPWLRLIVKPRSTFRYAMDHTTMKHATWLAILFGCLGLLTPFFEEPSNFLMKIIVTIIVGIMTGLLIWWLSYKLNYHIGRWLGGSGTKREMKIATAWAFIPSIIGVLLINLPFTVVYRDPALYYGNIDYPVQMIILYIGDLIGIWSFFISIIAISEAHRLSIWKSILVCIIPTIVLLLVSGVISLV